MIFNIDLRFVQVQQLDWSGSGQGQLASTCICGNEPLGSILCREFLE